MQNRTKRKSTEEAKRLGLPARREAPVVNLTRRQVARCAPHPAGIQSTGTVSEHVFRKCGPGVSELQECATNGRTHR
jgi:hypothetical protein